MKKVLLILIILFCCLGEAFSAGGGSTIYNYSNTKGNTANIDLATGKGSYQMGVGDPVSFTFESNASGLKITTDQGVTTCNLQGVCTGPNANDINNFDEDLQSNVDKFNSAQSPDTSSKDNILGISQNKLRNGDITMADIPIMIVSIIEFLLALAGSISVVALIYHAVRMQLASGITGDSSGAQNAKKGIKGALLGFVLSMSAWFLMTKFIELLSSST